MYLVYNIGHIHPFFNVPKQSNLLISVSGGSIYLKAWEQSQHKATLLRAAKEKLKIAVENNVS
jgi:hypothetical protein